jgi:two-component system LytT family response regulator
VDVVFLDIHMPGLSGFQVVERLPPDAMVVFTTAYDQHAVARLRDERGR